MDRYTKSFIVASLVYLVLAAVLGLWMGAGDAPDWARFAHVHFNLLGFMAMMVYGVGYFVIPRFNARELRWPSWVPVHFWLANVGLVGMVATYPRMPSTLFGVFGGISAVSVVLFAVNLIMTVVGPEIETAAAAPPPAPDPPQPEVPDVRTIAQMRVGQILVQWPHVADVLVAGGLEGLADPAHREQVKELPVTLDMACARHGLDVEELATSVRAAIGSAAPAIGPDDVLGDILTRHPAVEAVFRKYYGSGCFSCPGQATETVAQSAMMHNVPLDEVLAALNRAATGGNAD